ncbi:MAG: DUF1569 domain-containing protein [Gemmatimonadetes bacterium]|nr:DUF1569 domain-containing protein [Gemmatimonadota bacterium]
MKTLNDPAARREIITRLERLYPTTPGQFGTLTAPRMVTHLIDSARMMLDEVPGLGTGKPIASWPPIKQLIIYVLPIPKARAKTAPQLLATAPTNLGADIARLAELLERWGTGTRMAATHPFFGSMTRSSWGVLGYKHFDHHLRQFGV